MTLAELRTALIAQRNAISDLLDRLDLDGITESTITITLSGHAIGQRDFPSPALVDAVRAALPDIAEHTPPAPKKG